MRASRDFFLEKTVMLMAVSIPLALAESVWWYITAVSLAVTYGWLHRVWGFRALLGPITSRIFVLLAFAYLVYEFFWLWSIPVIALSHFMTIVCISKFLQERTLRDDAQLAVLSLLLLVVAAIVSGNVIFLVVLIVTLTAGLSMLVRFNLTLERVYVERANAPFRQPGEQAPTAFDRPAVIPRAMTVGIAMFAATAGILVFAFFPRVGAGMFGRVDNRGGGPTVTGLSSNITFDTVGTISESERPVMRVQIEATQGPPPRGEPVYFRGRVYNYYGWRGPESWEWRRPWRERGRDFRIEAALNRDEPLSLLPELEDPDGVPMWIERYQIESSALPDGILVSRYPPLALVSLNSDEIDGIGKLARDQSLRVSQSARKPLRYSLQSPASVTPEVVAALAAERESQGLDEPRAFPPNPPLPENERIQEMIAPLIAAAGPLDVPANRERFARSVVQLLTAAPFTYTLSPPSRRRGVEPIGQFLVETRTGYCQHFASAMTVMCQMAGVPARLVSGFRCDDYNSMGEFYSVRGKHAHAWVEVFIPGKDWVLFDPTPASTGRHASRAGWLRTIGRYSDYLQFQWSSLVLTYDAEARRELLGRFKDWLLRPARSEGTLLGRVWAFIHELFAWRVVMTWQDRLLYWVFALLIVAMVVLSGYVAVVLSMRAFHRTARFVSVRWPGSVRTGDAGLYHRLARRLAHLGLRRRAEQTPAEFAAELAAKYPVLEPASTLVGAYYEVVYGQQTLSPERRQMFEVFLTRLHNLNRAALGGE